MTCIQRKPSPTHMARLFVNTNICTVVVFTEKLNQENRKSRPWQTSAHLASTKIKNKLYKHFSSKRK